MGIITKLLNEPGEEPGFWYRKGKELAGSGYYLDSLEALDRMLLEEPSHAESWFLKGYVFYQMGRYDEALQLFDRALSHNPALHEALVYKGLLSSHSGKHIEALKLYDRALALCPTSVPAWYARGLTFAILEQYDEAILAYERVIAFDPQHIDALTGINSAMKKRDRIKTQKGSSSQPAKVRTCPENALTPVSYKPSATSSLVPGEGTVPVLPSPGLPPATRISPSVPVNPIDSGLFIRTTQSQKGQPERDVFQEVPHAAAVRKSIAVTTPPPVPVSRSANLYNEMIDRLHDILAANPRDSDSWHALGDQFLRIGKYRQATDAYERALECDSGRTATWAALGDARKKLGIYEEALIAYEQSLAIDPEQPAAWISHAKTLAMLGRYLEVIQSCDRATALDETNIEAWLYKGFILKKISRPDDALSAYNTVLKINPHHEHATRQRKSLIDGE